MINEVEQATIRINEMFNDMGVMVDEQGGNLEVISEELMKTNKNLVQANENMDQAATLQKKSRKKYLIFLLIVVVLVAVVVGIVLIL